MTYKLIFDIIYFNIIKVIVTIILIIVVAPKYIRADFLLYFKLSIIFLTIGVKTKWPKIIDMITDTSGMMKRRITVIIPRINPYRICPSLVSGVMV